MAVISNMESIFEEIVYLLITASTFYLIFGRLGILGELGAYILTKKVVMTKNEDTGIHTND